jgi:hypothetical protein
LYPPPYYATWNWAAAKASIAILAGLYPAVVAPDHGKPRTEWTAAALLELTARLNRDRPHIPAAVADPVV